MSTAFLFLLFVLLTSLGVGSLLLSLALGSGRERSAKQVWAATRVCFGGAIVAFAAFFIV